MNISEIYLLKYYVSSHLQWVCEQHDLSDGGGGQDGVKGRDLGS